MDAKGLPPKKAVRKPRKAKIVKRSDIIRSNRVRTPGPLPPQKTAFLIPASHWRKIMQPFLFYVRLWQGSDTYHDCLAYINRVSDYLTYRKEQHIRIPYNGTYGVFTRDPKTFNIIRNCLQKNQTFRWAMKRLIYRWRISKCKAMNTEDIFTGEVPVKSVEIYDWTQRRKYIFEAGTVYRDLLTKIQNACELFVSPMMPRNPFTNSELTYGQLHFTIRALISYGFNHWCFDALKKSGYCLKTFEEVYAYPLKYDNLKSIYRKPTEPSCAAIVTDFIEHSYEHHNVELPYPNAWYMALTENPDCEILQKWRALSLKHEQVLIRYDGGPVYDMKMLFIYAESLDLIRSSTKDIGIIWRKYLKRPEEPTVAELNGHRRRAASESEEEAVADADADADADTGADADVSAISDTTNQTIIFTYTYTPITITQRLADILWDDDLLDNWLSSINLDDAT
jgi:hypothetical protein